MNNSGPFWRSKLSVKTYTFYQLLFLSLGYVLMLILSYQQKLSTNIVESIMALLIIMMTNYLYNVVDLLFIKKVRNPIILKKAIDLKLFNYSLLVALFLPLALIIWLIPVIIIVKVITNLSNKKLKLGLVDDAMLTVIILLVISLVVNQFDLTLLTLDVARLWVWAFILMIFILYVTKIIKKRVLNGILLMIPVIYVVGYFLLNQSIVDISDYLLISGMPGYAIYYLFNPENTPTTKTAVSLIMGSLLLTIILGLVFNIEYILVILLSELFIFKIFRDGMDYIGLKK